ncbi:MAG: hypothetical protein WC220_06760, partial [Pedobacter sp.]
MKRVVLFCALFSLIHIYSSPVYIFKNQIDIKGTAFITDSLPSVLTKNHADLLESRLRNEAILRFGTHQLPDNVKDWEKYRSGLRKNIIQKTGLIVNHDLPLDMKET